MKKISLIVTLALLSDYLCGQSNYVYLGKVLDNLNQIKSAAYFYTASASAPGDTLTFSTPQRLYIKEYVNPSDSFVGASYAKFEDRDTTKILNFYDGSVEGRFDWDEKTIKIDSFINYPYPFRLVLFPFHTRTANIIKYALETDDSIKIETKDFGDSVLFSLHIYDKVVEFVTEPFVDINPGQSSAVKISRYDMWINKSDNLPFRMRRMMPHQTSFETCTRVKLNSSDQRNFVPSDYFPKDFSIVPLKREKRKTKSDLEGKVAIDWVLEDINNHTIGLTNLNKKVIMIQFTGVGCGPCHESIPFLKQLVNDYQNKDFEFIAIETWSKNIDGLKRYQNRNGLNFKFLKSNEDVIKNYQVKAVPVFFILDKSRVIKKVIYGYRKGLTDKEILNVINELL